MGTSTYSDEFKRDAAQQIAVRGYPVREVSRRLGVSSHALYKWLRLFVEPSSKAIGIDHEAENRRLKRELARVTEERDILKMGEPWIAIGSRAIANAYFARAVRRPPPRGLYTADWRHLPGGGKTAGRRCFAPDHPHLLAAMRQTALKLRKRAPPSTAKITSWTC